MASSWLPPLNSNENYKVNVGAAQLEPPYYDSSSMYFKFKICIDVMVVFKSENPSNTTTFPGLYTFSPLFTFPCFCLDCIAKLLSSVDIPFHFEKYDWGINLLASEKIEWHRGVRLDSDGQSLIDNIFVFLLDLSQGLQNQNVNVVPVEFIFSKIVKIPDSELDAWSSWHSEKAKYDENFELDFARAISRPRTQEELYESSLKLNAATKSSVEGLEEVDIDSKNSSEPCSICWEELEMGSKAINMPCSHVFHRSCIVNWLKERNMCPLCRYELLR